MLCLHRYMQDTCTRSNCTSEVLMGEFESEPSAPNQLRYPFRIVIYPVDNVIRFSYNRPGAFTLSWNCH